MRLPGVLRTAAARVGAVVLFFASVVPMTIEDGGFPVAPGALPWLRALNLLFAAALEKVPLIQKQLIEATNGKGKIVIGSLVQAEMTPFVGATGNPTTLAETVFSTIPGSPVYAAKADHYKRDGSGHGIPIPRYRCHAGTVGMRLHELGR